MATIIPSLPGKTDDPHWERKTLDTPRDVPPDDERLQLVERIAGSEAFQKSSRLPPLLRYLATCTLANNRAALSEQAIGRTVFDKSADFNPTEDSSVRVYMRQLRLRLHEYYQGTGQDEAVVIEIPKGGYALAFHARHVIAAPPIQDRPVIEALAGVPTEVSQPVYAERHRLLPMLPWLLLIASLLLGAVGWYRWSRAVAATTPPWPLNQVIQSGQQTTVVLADGSYVLRLLGDREITLDEYGDHHYADALIPKSATEGELRLFHYLQSSQITSMADAHAASSITALAGSLRQNIQIRSAKGLNGSMLAGGNFIFVGASTSNPWVELYESRLNFRLVEIGFRGTRFIENRSPRPGEQPVYSVAGFTGVSGDDYATISLVPVTGDQGAALLLQGLRLEGTDAAIRFLDIPSNRDALAEKLKAVNGGTLPRYFEALLHAHSLGGAAASVECVAVRTITPPHS